MLNKNLQVIINGSVELAKEMGHSILTTEHVFLSLLINPHGADIITKLGGDVEDLKITIERYLHSFLDEPNMTLSNRANSINAKPLQTIALENIFETMIAISEQSQKKYVDIYDLLIAITSDRNSYSTKLLEYEQLGKADILEAINNQHLIEDEEESDSPLEPPHSFRQSHIPRMNKLERKALDELSNMRVEKSKNDALSLYTRELVALAKEGAIDPVIGRDDEIKRVVEILARRKKNNPLLVGEPGVGKTAIAEGIALKIAGDEIIPQFQQYRIYALDMGLLISGTKYRGDFEKRLKDILEALKKQKKAILFIDEIHTIVDSGNTSGSSLDTANILKPALSNGALHCIGATTHSEFRKYFDKDKALSRRFAKVNIDEPSIEDTIKIITNLSSIYEKFHDVKYSKDALEACVMLSDKYINDKFLPDKAIDLLDEAGAYCKIYGTMQKSQGGIVIKRADIEFLVSKNTKMPLHNSASDLKLLKQLQTMLKKRIFGQDSAIEILHKSLIKNKAGLGNPNKPIGVFLFTGPTGVGKSELAKELALNLGISFQRFDMSEYSEAHTISRLIGAPAGYVGFEEGGLLVESIRKNSNCVLLLDEIEKAHNSIYNLLLQVFDNATLTDNSGNKADFRNVIIIMTSNIGSKDLPALGFNNDKKESVSRAIKDLFSPELRNRLDAIIQFEPLNESHLHSIIKKQIDDMNAQLKKQTITLKPKVYDYLLSLDYDKSMGAREIERLIEREIKLPLSEIILFAKQSESKEILVEVKGDSLHFTQNPKQPNQRKGHG